MDYSVYETWLIIALAALATGGWRLAGLLLADLITPDSWVMQWVNAVLIHGRGGVDADYGLSHRRAGHHHP